MSYFDILENNKQNVIQRYADGQSANSIAKDYNVNSYYVWKFLKRNGVEMKNQHTPRRNNKQLVSQVISLFQEGNSAYSIGTNLGIDVSVIVRLLNANGVDTSVNSKLRDDLLKNHTNDIINLYQRGESMCKIADKYKASDVSVLRILDKNGINRRPLRKYSWKEDYFDKIDTEEKAYIFGFFTADGNNARKSFKIEICDLEILEKMKSCIGYTGPIYEIPQENPKHKTRYSLCIYSQRFCDNMTKMGCPPVKTLVTKFPSEDIVPKNLIHHYIRGEFDGDGSVGAYGAKKRPQIQIAGTRDLLDGIVNFLGIHATYSHSHPERGKDTWVIHYGSKLSIQTFYDVVYKDATIYLDRKKKKFEEILGISSSGGAPGVSTIKT